MSTPIDPLFWIILAIAAVLVIAGSVRKHRAPSTAVFRYKIVSVVPDDAGKRATLVMLQGPSGITHFFYFARNQFPATVQPKVLSLVVHYNESHSANPMESTANSTLVADLPCELARSPRLCPVWQTGELSCSF